MTTTHHSYAARVGVRIRAHMAAKEWAWRYAEPTDPIDAAAITTLRDDASRARRWLALAAEAIGMPLPFGNGINGPWQRTAVVDVDGILGILDIAAGRIAWTDTGVPSYVWRFALCARSARSPNLAGGCGGMGDRAVAQIALVYGVDRVEPRISPLPHPVVVEVEYGLTTCYHDIGTAPTAGEYRTEWVALAGISARDTTAPQSERWTPPGGRSMNVEHARALLQAIPYPRASVSTAEGGVDHAGVRGEHELRIRGQRADREHTIRVLDAAHAAYSTEALRIAEIRARRALGLPVSQRDHDDARGLHTAIRAARDAAARV